MCSAASLQRIVLENTLIEIRTLITIWDSYGEMLFLLLGKNWVGEFLWMVGFDMYL